MECLGGGKAGEVFVCSGDSEAYQMVQELGLLGRIVVIDYNDAAAKVAAQRCGVFFRRGRATLHGINAHPNKFQNAGVPPGGTRIDARRGVMKMGCMW
jgi:hypothetical protein